MSYLVDALDQALTLAGEDIVLRRRTGEGDAATYQTVTCRARVNSIDNTQNPAGTRLSELSVILSPTQIIASGWPGAAADTQYGDPRIPRVNDTDDVIIRGQPPRTIIFCDPKVISGELVRIELKVVA